MSVKIIPTNSASIVLAIRYVIVMFWSSLEECVLGLAKWNLFWTARNGLADLASLTNNIIVKMPNDNLICLFFS